MGSFKLTIAIMLKLLFAFCLSGYSLHAIADESVIADKSSPARHEVTLIRDRDYKCTQCHKDSKETLSGSHGENAHESLGREVNCTNCHNNIGPDHRDGAPLVTKFSSAQSQPGTDKTLLSQEEILQNNGQCMDCHTNRYLRSKSWTHDVHAQNLTCSNCHTVHASKAKVLSADHKSQIKMCVDCHSDFNQLKEER